MSGAHTDDGWKMWKKVFFIVGVPVIALGHVSAFVLPDASEHDPPEFIPYDHLRIRLAENVMVFCDLKVFIFRTKKFPWGDGNHSLIHNPHANALPDGYHNEH